MTILYCGPYFSEKAIREKSSVSQAGARWSLGLVDALRRQGHKVIVVTHCTERIWPYGKVLWSNAERSLFWDDDCVAISYPNMPVLRTVWLDWRYAAAVRKICRGEMVDAFICYNTFAKYHVAAMKAARECGVFCAPIILDGDDPRKDDWRRMLRDNRFASGVVFLSHWLVRNYPLGVYSGGKMPIHHLDGGAESFLGIKPSQRQRECQFTVLHTGSLNKQRELSFIAKALKSYGDINTKFVFTGKVSREDVREMCGDDPRIEVKGFVSVGELNAICQRADAFLNVRVPDHGDNVVNFPSKLPQSLSWGRPVVSTWVESLAPHYRDFLFLADNNTPEGLSSALERVRKLDLGQRISYYDREKFWFIANKTWDAQARGLAAWLTLSISKY